MDRLDAEVSLVVAKRAHHAEAHALAHECVHDQGTACDGEIDYSVDFLRVAEKRLDSVRHCPPFLGSGFIT